jgi:hypothetical protein
MSRILTVILALFLISSAAAAAEPQPMAAPRGVGQPGAAPAPPGAAPAAAPAPATHVPLSINLAGTWAGDDRSSAGMGLPAQHVVIMYKADGTFNQWITAQGGFTVQIWGNYTVTATSPTTGFLSATPVGWAPQQQCWMTTGGCTPLTFQATQLPLTVVDPADIQVGQIYLRKQG